MPIFNQRIAFCLLAVLLAGCGRFAQDGGSGASLLADAPPAESPPPVQWDRDSPSAAKSAANRPEELPTTSGAKTPDGEKPLDRETDFAADLDAELARQRSHLEQQLTVQIEVKGERGKRDVDGWYEAISPPGKSVAARPSGQYRWHHPRIDEMLARPPERSPDLRLVLTSENPLVSAAAGIGLARQEPGQFDEWLALTVRTPALPLSVRRAAAETLAHSTGKSAEPLLLELLEEYGDFSGKGGAVYVPALHAELLRGLAECQIFRSDAADEFPRRREYARQAVAELNRSWKSPAPEARLAAAETWDALSLSADLLQRAASELFTDNDPRVRIAGLKMFGRAKHPYALSQLMLACDDPVLAVKLAAIEGLGQFGGNEAKEKLQEILRGRAERLRQAAVTALAHCGELSLVAEAATDTAWMVRGAVAEALSEWVTSTTAPFPPAISQQAVPLARKLLTDPSGEVRLRAAQSLANWPIVLSGPLLLDALESNDLRLRVAAAGALEKALPAAADFPAKAPLDQRRDALVKLRAAWQRQYPPHDFPAASPSAESAAESHSDPQVRPAAHLEPGGATAAVELRRMNVLDIAHAMRLVEQLDGKASGEQSQAANGLAALGKKWLFAPEIVDGIAARLSADTSAVVWVSLLIALENQTAPSARRIVHLAASQPTPEVRRRACAWMAGNPAREHIEIIEPLLADSDPSVQHEAVTAAGRQPGFDEASLARLLASPDRHLRVKVALALCRLGSTSGLTALERLSLDDDAKIRLETATAMGEMGDKQFISSLVRLLDDSVTVQRAAMSSLKQIAGKDIAEGAPTQLERIRAWKKWAGN